MQVASALVTDRANPSAAQEAQAREFLVFGLGGEEYAIDIRKVQELRGYEPATRIANTPEHVKGVINLRGIIVPIFDMRIRFALGKPTYDGLTVVIILNVAGRVVGMVVDSVSDVVTLRSGQIKPPPDMRTTMLDNDYLLGLGMLDDRMLIMADIDKLMIGDELDALQASAADLRPAVSEEAGA